MPVSGLHRQIAALALAAAGEHGFALGSGNALARGVTSRPIRDAGLSTGQEHGVQAAAGAAQAALRGAGFRPRAAAGLDDGCEIRRRRAQPGRFHRAAGTVRRLAPGRRSHRPLQAGNAAGPQPGPGHSPGRSGREPGEDDPGPAGPQQRPGQDRAAEADRDDPVPVESALDLGLRVTAYAPDRSAVL